MMKHRKSRRQNLGYLHALFCECRNIRFRLGNVERDDSHHDPFQRRSAQQITYKKLVKDTKDKKTPIEQCKDRVEEARKIAELLHLQSESRWNESDPVYFLLSNKWLNRLKDYLCYDYIIDCLRTACKNNKPATISVKRLMAATNRHPGPINNTDILMNENDFFPDWNDTANYLNTPLKKEIKKHEFIIVSRYLWSYLKSEYGLYYSTLQITGALNITQEQDYERQEIRRFTYFTAERKNIRRCQLALVKLFIARRGKKLEDAEKYLILKQRASWDDVKKRFVKVVPNYSNLDYKQNMRLWILNENYATMETFTEYYNSSILRGDATDDFTIPAYCLDNYGNKLVEQTVELDNPDKTPIIIAEIKSKDDLVWQFKHNSKQNKLRMHVTGREIGKEYMMNENSDSDSDDGKPTKNVLNSKLMNNESNTVHGDFKVYFQQTLCTKEFYDMEAPDAGIFEMVEQMEIRRKQRIEEKKTEKARLQDEERQKKIDDKRKLKEEREAKGEEPLADEYILKAKGHGRVIICSYCTKDDSSGEITLSCTDCHDVFYCSEECMGKDRSMHTPHCSKEFVNTSFGLVDDNINFKSNDTTKDQDDDEDLPAAGELKEEDVRMLDTDDSQDKDSQILETKQEIKKDPDLDSQDSDELLKGKLIYTNFCIERDNTKMVQLQNLKDADELLLKNEDASDKSGNLDDLLGLEVDSMGSGNSSQNEANTQNEDFYKQNDEEINALLMDDKSLDEDMSELSDSDNETKKDPCFKQQIEID
jgi:hypothetical protein